MSMQQWKLVGTIGRYVLLKYVDGKHVDTLELPADTNPETAVYLETELNAAFVAGYDSNG